MWNTLNWANEGGGKKPSIDFTFPINSTSYLLLSSGSACSRHYLLKSHALSKLTSVFCRQGQTRTLPTTLFVFITSPFTPNKQTAGRRAADAARCHHSPQVLFAWPPPFIPTQTPDCVHIIAPLVFWTQPVRLDEISLRTRAAFFSQQGTRNVGCSHHHTLSVLLSM